MKVRLSDRAQSDLDDVFAYIAADSKFYAMRFLLDLRQAMRLLAKFPQSGRTIPKYGDPAIREKFYRNYRIAYSITEDAIEIATIHHVAKMPDN